MLFFFFSEKSGSAEAQWWDHRASVFDSGAPFPLLSHCVKWGCWALILIFEDFVPSISVSIFPKRPTSLMPKLGHRLLRPKYKESIEPRCLGTPFRQSILSSFQPPPGGRAVVAKRLSVKNSGLFVRAVAVPVANTHQSWGPWRWHSGLTKE